jgi:hypothetical protein
MTHWVPAPVAIAAAVVAFAALAAHTWQAFPNGYLGCISGIWLALGRDLAGGVFFRDLIGPLGYGGTRYFPLFFTLIGSMIAVGLPPLAAGWLASAFSGVVLATGAARVSRALDAPRHVAWLAAAGAVAPYFVQQTLFEIRADVLAAGLNLWGLAAVTPLFRAPYPAKPRTWPAVVWFTLALSAKVTSLAVPAAACLALVLARRARLGVRLFAGMAGGSALFLAVVQAASGGRALISWRACMFAGATSRETMTRLLTGESIAPATSSHLIVALFALVGLALAAAACRAFRDRRRGVAAAEESRLPLVALWLPLVLFAAVTASTALTLSSPGSVPSNHLVEWLAVAVVILVWAAAARPELRIVLSSALALVVLWMSAQDAVRASRLWQTRATRTSTATRQQVTELVAHARAPVLSESAVWPVLAGQEPVLVDPFSLRVVMRSHPDIARDVEARIEARAFSTVILQVDPTSARGRGFYEELHFGWPVVSRVLAHYRFESQPASDVWIYVPKGHDER